MTTDSHIQSLFRQAGKNLPAIDQLANHSLLRRLPLIHALRAYKGYLVYKPGSANAAFNYAFYLGKDAQFEAAISMYQRALKLGIDARRRCISILPISIWTTCEIKMARRGCICKRHWSKIRLCRCVLQPGHLEEQAGDRECRGLSFEQCLKIDPANESAWRVLPTPRLSGKTTRCWQN